MSTENRASGVSPQRIKACLEACAGMEDPAMSMKLARMKLEVVLKCWGHDPALRILIEPVLRSLGG